MEATIQQQLTLESTIAQTKTSVFSKFVNWCNSQEKYRFGWLAAILAIHGCILTPITIFAITLTGVHIALFMVAIVAMGVALVTNLSAMPTRITVPVFFLSVLVDIVLIIMSVSMAL